MQDYVDSEEMKASYERRYMSVLLREENLLKLIQGKCRIINLPDDVVILSVDWHIECGAWFMVIASLSFERVEEGFVFPKMDLMCEVILEATASIEEGQP